MKATLNKVDSSPNPERTPRNLHLASMSPSPVDPESRFLGAVTGASGVAYAMRLIELPAVCSDVIVTKAATAVIEIEACLSAKAVDGPAGTLYRGSDDAGAPASG